MRWRSCAGTRSSWDTMACGSASGSGSAPVCSIHCSCAGRCRSFRRRNFATFSRTFLASLTVCGLIAAAYPFFLGSALGTSAFYPTFVRAGTTTPYDAADLASLERALWPHLALAAAVPLVGVAGLVIVDTRQQWPMLTLCGSGLLGLAMAVALMKRIQRDVADLLPAVSPGDPRVDSMYSSRG